jgi:magnesium-transporting ATPase (P-type)
MSIFSPPQREKVESELAFLGLLIMENRLKKETRPVLKELSEARIRTVMVTGMCASRVWQLTKRREV